MNAPHAPDPNITAPHQPGTPSTIDVTGAYAPAPSTEPSATGRPTDLPTVPGYEVTGELARGGMGRVLAARDPAFGREVAVKVLLPGQASDDAAQRFVREAAITGRLTHPGIPPAYQLGELPDGSPFLAMKLVRGRTLDALLKARPSPSADLPRFVGVFEAVCQAVGYAHSRGVIHRDVKPGNVMVGEFGEVQVMDWGAGEGTHTVEPRGGAERVVRPRHRVGRGRRRNAIGPGDGHPGVHGPGAGAG